MVRNAAACTALAISLAACMPSGGVETRSGELDDLRHFVSVGPELNPCTVENTSAKLGVTFERVEERQFFDTYVAVGTGAIASYQLRAAKAAAKSGHLLIAELKANAVRVDQVTAMIGRGEDPALLVESPGLYGGRQPYGSLSYDQGRNDVAIVYALAGRQMVESVSVNCR